MLVKTKISPEIKFSGLSNKINSKSQINPRILVKLIQNKKKCDREKGRWEGGGEGGEADCRLVPGQTLNRNYHIAFSSRIFP